MSVRAPFDFARIARWVHTPAWGRLVSHYVPFKDGLNGTAKVEITAQTPLLVGGPRSEAGNGQAGDVWPFQLPDGTWAIPQSSIQGMCRAILEIAGFGRLGDWVEDRRYGLRDLSKGATAQETYQKRLSKKIDNIVHPKSQAGWLIKDTEGRKRIVKCRLSRISFWHDPERGASDLHEARASIFESLEVLLNNPKSRGIEKASDARQRYAWYQDGTARLDVLNGFFDVDDATVHTHSSCDIFYSKCRLGSPTDTPGTIVITGKNPGPPNHSIMGAGMKKQEFVFHTPSRTEPMPVNEKDLNVSDDVWRDFTLGHFKQKGGDANPNWEFWKDEFEEGIPVPVFYWVRKDASGNEVLDCFGTAFVPKAVHTASTHDLLRNSSPDHFDQDNTAEPDLAELVFGSAAEKHGGRGLRRRAWFSVAEDKSGKKYPPDSPKIGHSAVLLSPKPSYAGLYVRQPPNEQNETLKREAMATYSPVMEIDGTATHDLVACPEVSGVKIWPSTPENTPVQIQVPRKADGTELSKDLQTRLHAVPAGTEFSADLTFHNLRPVELGALLWALSFGDAKSFGADASGVALRHRLGMGKPYRIGQISIRVSELSLDTECPGFDSNWTAVALVKTFEDYMASQYPRGELWNISPQIAALLKAANPSRNEEKAQTPPYMPLEPRGQEGTYIEEKTEERFLKPYVPEIAEIEKPRCVRRKQSLSPEPPSAPDEPTFFEAEPGSDPDGFEKGDRVRVGPSANPNIAKKIVEIQSVPLSPADKIPVCIPGNSKVYDVKREQLTRIEPDEGD